MSLCTPGCGLMTVGSILRVFSLDSTVYLISAHLGAILVGIAGIMVMAAPTALSAAWFPAHQRTTATAIAMVSNGLGNGVSFFVGPLMVPDSYINKTDHNTIHVLTNFTETPSREDVRHQIWWYMVALAIPATLTFVAMVAYFPSKPPLPPSASASAQVQRTSFKESVRILFTNKNAILCMLALALSSGIQGSWAGVMTINFEPLGKTSPISSNTFLSILAKKNF